MQKNGEEDTKEREREMVQDEQKHLAECRQLIAKNVSYYEEEYQYRKDQTARLRKTMQAGDVELYDQLMTSISLEEHTKNQLRKNKAALNQPYFGRIDYTEGEKERESVVYIGKNGVTRDKTDVVIADWRAPISGVYYENELGEGIYLLPDGEKMPIDLHKKRTYDIRDGELKGYYDSDVAANDELLIQYLSQNKDVVLGDIIATIQKEQNRIIRESPFANIIVQGVAGSGKTTVAMHRISYILYNYKERFMSNEFCIIGGNDVLLNYITSGLPELDVPDMKQKRMDVMLVHLLGKEWKKKYQVIENTKDAVTRSKIVFMLELEVFLGYLRAEVVDCSELRDSRLGVILSEKNNRQLVAENQDLSAFQLLALLEERMKTRIRFLCPDGAKEFLQKKLQQYKNHYKNKMTSESIYSIYQRFLTEYEKRYKGSLCLEELFENHAKGKFDVYDLAALLLIQYRITRKKPDEEFGQIFIDEAQDFGITPYYALRKVLPQCYFTIMGDVSQNINYDTGLNEWSELQKWMFTGNKDHFCLLSKSYRNTIEISEYAGKILEKASFGRYKIEPVIRHGIPVQEYSVTTRQALQEKAEQIIAEMNAKGYQSIAVVCENDAEAELVKEELGLQAVTVLPIHLVKGLEFDGVILWNPDIENSLKEPGRAKRLYVAVTRALHELHIIKF